MFVGNSAEFDGTELAAQHSAGAFTQNLATIEKADRISGEPIDLFGADDQTFINIAIPQPMRGGGESNEEGAGIAHECVVNRGAAEIRGNVAGGRIEDRFWKDQRTGSGRIL